MNAKRKGHVICPNCGKESYVIVRRGEAEVWCRKCRTYFSIIIETKSGGNQFRSRDKTDDNSTSTRS
ncbi:MAG: hypothetical protein ABIH42_07570 [Planctomycetota bacterium]